MGESWVFTSLFTFIYYVCIRVGMCTPARVEVKGQLADVIVPLWHVGLGGWIEGGRLGSKHLCSPGRIAGSGSLTDSFTHTTQMGQTQLNELNSGKPS